MTSKSYGSLSTGGHVSPWGPRQPSSPWGVTPSPSFVVSRGAYCRNPLPSWGALPFSDPLCRQGHELRQPHSLSSLGCHQGGGQVKGKPCRGQQEHFCQGDEGSSHLIPTLGLQHSVNLRSPQIHPINELCKCEISTPFQRRRDQQRCTAQHTRCGPGRRARIGTSARDDPDT